MKEKALVEVTPQTMRVRLFAALTDKPQLSKAVAEAAGLEYSEDIKECLRELRDADLPTSKVHSSKEGWWKTRKG